MGKSPRVLMINDSEEAARRILQALRKGGLDPDVLQVSDVPALQEALLSRSWDVILQGGCLSDGSSGEAAEETSPGVYPAGTVWSVNRAAEEKLKENEERFKALFDHSRDCVYVLDLAGNFIDANEAALRLLGYERAEIPALNILSLLAREDRERGVREFEEIVRTGFQTRDSGYALLGKDNRRIDVETRAVVVCRDGKPHSLLGIARDVTRRKTAEIQLRNDADEISDLYDNAPCGYYSLAPDGSFLRINATALKWLGYACDDLIGRKKWSDLLTKASQDIFRGVYPRLEKQGWINDVELEVVRKDGSVFTVLQNARAITDEAGRFVQSRSTIFDITQLKKTRSELRTKHMELTRAYEDLRDKQEMILMQDKMASIGMLAAGVAHEIKNPLAIILQGMNYLQTAVASDALTTEVIERLTKAVLHADSIVKGLLSYSRQTPVAPVRQDVRNLLEESLVLTEHEFHAKNIHLVRNYQLHLPRIPLDGNQLKQVFVNLIINAIEAMPQQGTLTIGAGRIIDNAGKEFLRLSFRDTGRGISAEQLPQIFDPFYTTKPIGNTGLGLAVSKGIIDMHGGIIYAESQEGEGTSIVIQLPVPA